MISAEQGVRNALASYLFRWLEQRSPHEWVLDVTPGGAACPAFLLQRWTGAHNPQLTLARLPFDRRRWHTASFADRDRMIDDLIAELRWAVIAVHAASGAAPTRRGGVMSCQCRELARAAAAEASEVLEDLQRATGVQL